MHAQHREDPQVELQARSPRGIGAGDAERDGGAIGHLARVAKLLALLLLLVAWPARAAEPVVILLSWDGVRHDLPDRARTPALDRVAQSGTHAALRPVFPTNTFPNHVSLATGTFVDRHGIVGNVFEDRERGRYRYSNDASWIEAEPIWAAAERQGVRAASFFWVGSETDWRGRGASYRRAPFDTKLGEDEKVDQILAWLDLPAAERPGLIVSWWHGADHAGHERGPDHADVVRALERQDVQLLRLLEGLDVRGAWDDTTLIIVSDHGMSAARGSVEVLGPLRAAGIGARLIAAGGCGYLLLEEPTQASRAAALLNGVAGLEAWPSAQLPQELRAYFPGRSGDVVVLTAPPRAISRPRRGQADRVRGMHGYRPDHPDMAAIFYAMGRGVPQGAPLSSPRTIDVAPTAAHLLGIAPPSQSEGTPLF